MAVSLTKGQKIDLTKPTGASLNEIMVGLGWDEAQQAKGGLFGKFKSAAPSVDCDASIILCGADGKRLPGTDKDCCIYFANRVNKNGSIAHNGDNLTGAGFGDDEQIMIKLQDIPTECEKLVFVVNIYNGRSKNQHFGLIKNAFIRIVDLKDKNEFCNYNLSENYNDMTGLVVAEIYKHNGAWKFNAIGQGVQEADTLDKLIDLYN